ncbi:NUDIX domain-containing protein [Methylovirgula sp. 4M-Z18]|uniref:NUDIX domain-containing protein n=1 Tax=Methylovirgula sp. 4M-Z18 TaxID=2293567 RepID=UPI000E2F113A|nr:NUDIX domain-containing protein [Methylovirgula sp. 4M-Z18]RFB81324.1 NUDIX domain-containing protein [Methylovirgula sp. 4M-Z18]
MKTPGVGCGAFIERDGHVLLIKRVKAPEAGTWNLIGGKVDFGERAEDAVVRETAEEIGVSILLQGFLCLVQMIGIDGQHWVSPVYRARIVAGEPSICEPDKIADLGWYPFDDLPQPLGLPVREAIAALRR